MKILFIKDKRSESGIEGGGVYLLNVCIELNRLNIPYLVLYNDKDQLYEKMISNSVNVKIIPLPPGSFKNLLHKRKKVRATQDIISNIIISENVTHINVHFPYLLNYIKPDINIPVIAHWHGAFVDNSPLKYFYLKDIFSARKIINNIYKKKYTLNFDRADYIVCASNAAMNTAVKHFQVPGHKIRINPYGIPKINTKLCADIRKDLGFSADDRIILSVGRETKSKGVEDFCEVAKAFAHQKDIRFIFIGGYRDEGYHKELVKKYGEYVSFLGMRNDVNNFYKTADLFLYLSHRESAGLVLAESMFFGVPLVTWNIIGVNEMFENGVQGRMENFGDLKAIIRDVDEILSDEKKYSNYAIQSKLKAKKYLIQASVEGLIKIFNLCGAYSPQLEAHESNGCKEIEDNRATPVTTSPPQSERRV